MLGTGICQMYYFLDGYLVLTNKFQYGHQGGFFQDLCSSHVNLIQSRMNTIQLRMDYVNFFGMEIVKEKDKPKEIWKDKYHEYVKNGILIIRLFITLFITGKVVILDNIFCVLLALIASKKMGVVSAALINKRRHWPQYVEGKEIKEIFEDATVGDIQILPGKINGVKFDLFFLKETDYVMTLMSTY